jgi:uncharacterized protein YceK
MKLKQQAVKTALPSGPGRLVRHHCFGVLANQIRQSPLLAIMLAITIVLATGCSSMATAFSARLISPNTANQQTSNSEDDGWYQPPRSPGFDDLFGS